MPQVAVVALRDLRQWGWGFDISSPSIREPVADDGGCLGCRVGGGLQQADGDGDEVVASLGGLVPLGEDAWLVPAADVAYGVDDGAAGGEFGGFVSDRSPP